MSEETTNIAAGLLEIKAVRLQPQNPFTWASGWKSPVYCDNRLALSYPGLRAAIRNQLVNRIREIFPEANGVAGVATAGIPQGALVADQLDLPFIYVRSKPKGHGLTNQIEGQLQEDLSYVVVEDLISTGGSSLKAIEAIRAAGGKVAGLISIFTYGFPQAEEAMAGGNVKTSSLINLNEMLAKAVEIKYISPAEMEVINAWRKDPAAWAPSASIDQ